MGQMRGWSMYSPGGGRGRLKVGWASHPILFLVSPWSPRPIRTWSPQMAVSPCPWTPCSRTQPYHGCRDHIRPLAILHPFQSALTAPLRKVQLKCASGLHTWPSAFLDSIPGALVTTEFAGPGLRPWRELSSSLGEPCGNSVHTQESLLGGPALEYP